MNDNGELINKMDDMHNALLMSAPYDDATVTNDDYTCPIPLIFGNPLGMDCLELDTEEGLCFQWKDRAIYKVTLISFSGVEITAIDGEEAGKTITLTDQDEITESQVAIDAYS